MSYIIKLIIPIDAYKKGNIDRKAFLDAIRRDYKKFFPAGVEVEISEGIEEGGD